MSPGITAYAGPAIRVLLSLAFLAAGLSKLAGVEMMVQTFDKVGFGQWFRYLTGLIEVGGAIALWLPGYRLYAAGLLLCTMAGAVVAHLVVLGPSAVPATVLGLLLAATMWIERNRAA